MTPEQKEELSNWATDNGISTQKLADFVKESKNVHLGALSYGEATSLMAHIQQNNNLKDSHKAG